ncbi:hypothetical protein ACFGVR_10820 [Mucilaginibacter sp. AW1-3]
MTIIKSTPITEMIDRFDNELKTLLMNDLKAVKAAKSKILNSIQRTAKLSIV